VCDFGGRAGTSQAGSLCHWLRTLPQTCATNFFRPGKSGAGRHPRSASLVLVPVIVGQTQFAHDKNGQLRNNKKWSIDELRLKYNELDNKKLSERFISY